MSKSKSVLTTRRVLIGFARAYGSVARIQNKLSKLEKTITEINNEIEEIACDLSDEVTLLGAEIKKSTHR